MKHLGDITKISGRDAPTVNVIIGGSPCQDLSVAGKRAGLNGERSGLFMEQIRIIKEMREKDAESGRTGADIRPRFMVWENVPGAFSVNGGRDFAAVLEETIRVVDKEAPDIQVPCDGWTNSGCFMGNGYSIAWRVLDAQFWGVPQRRRRIALVADFGGQCAPEILFERESVSGHSEQSETARQGTAGEAADSTGTAGKCLNGWDVQSKHIQPENGIAECLWAGDARYGGGESYVMQRIGEICLNPHDSQSARAYDANGVWHSLNANSNGDQSRDAVFCLQGNGIDRSDTAGCTGKSLLARDDITTSDLCCVTFNGQTCGTLDAHYAQCPGARGGIERDVVAVRKERYIVRRLTPLECERLQGFPDGWTDIGEWIDTKGKKHKPADSPRYKALGNSIAIPPWLWVLSRLNAYCEEKTMASLFDGIGGFPLIWEFLNGKGSAVWCSEIEEFPIAVTKVRFPE